MTSELWWYVIRASGLAAWALASASVLVGLVMATGLVSVRNARNLHSWLGGLTIVMIVAHLGSLVADSFMTFDLADVTIPFASSWRPLAVAWGVVAMYLLVAVEATSLVKSHLPVKVWRGVHLASFFGFWAATFHAVTAGTDLGVPAIAAIVVSVVAAVLGLLLLRIGQSVVPGARARLAKRRKALTDRTAPAPRPAPRVAGVGVAPRSSGPVTRTHAVVPRPPVAGPPVRLTEPASDPIGPEVWAPPTLVGAAVDGGAPAPGPY